MHSVSFAHFGVVTDQEHSGLVVVFPGISVPDFPQLFKTFPGKMRYKQ